MKLNSGAMRAIFLVAAGTAVAGAKADNPLYAEFQDQLTRSVFRLNATVSAPDYTVSSATANGQHHLSMQKGYDHQEPNAKDCTNTVSVANNFPVYGSPLAPLDVLSVCTNIVPTTPDCSATLAPYIWSGFSHAAYANIEPSTSGVSFSADKISSLLRAEYRGPCIDVACGAKTAPELVNYSLTRVQSQMTATIPTTAVQSLSSSNKLALQIYPGIENRAARFPGCSCTYNYGLGDAAERIAFCLSVTFHGSGAQVSNYSTSGTVSLSPWGVDTISGFFSAHQTALDLRGYTGLNSSCSGAIQEMGKWMDQSDADVIPDFADSPQRVDIDVSFPNFAVSSIEVSLTVDLSTVSSRTASPTAPARSPWGTLQSVVDATNLLSFDFDGDGVLESTDRWAILTFAVQHPCAALAYDYNGDGVVDGRDLPCPSALFGCISDVGSQGGTYGPDGVVNNNDEQVFADLFFADDPRGDLGGQGGSPCPDGLFDNNDWVVFYNHFFDPC